MYITVRLSVQYIEANYWMIVTMMFKLDSLISRKIVLLHGINFTPRKLSFYSQFTFFSLIKKDTYDGLLSYSLQCLYKMSSSTELLDFYKILQLVIYKILKLVIYKILLFTFDSITFLQARILSISSLGSPPSFSWNL